LKMKAGHSYQDQSLKLPISLSGFGPWNVQIARYNSDKDLEAGEEAIEEFPLRDWDSQNLQVPISKPGLYVLKSVSDAFCEGHIDLPSSTCLIQQKYPPTISVAAEPIEQSCVGAIGALVNVSLTGDPPFWIDYDEVYKNSRTRRTIRLNKLRDTLSFKPSLPGTYVYEFKMVISIELFQRRF
jgi:hypothetical protein